MTTGYRVVNIDPAGRICLTTGDQADWEFEITENAAQDAITVANVRAMLVGSGERRCSLAGETTPIALTQQADPKRWRISISRERTAKLSSGGILDIQIQDGIALLELQIGDVLNGDATERTEYIEIDVQPGVIE